MGYPSTCLVNLPSAKKVQSLHNLFNNFLGTNFLQKGSSFFLLLDKACYREKINRLTNDGISKGVQEKNDKTLAELKSFQNFINRNFKKHEKYK